ncbi:hypothetical protein F5Y01DRAFT_267150 [Xylaria sp. FL0043]|nr:hypothetical protein F5Y01DRAFT_267150 [Xylaria sp. FL0043]
MRLSHVMRCSARYNHPLNFSSYCRSLTVPGLAGSLIYDGAAMPMAARAHARVTNMHRRRNSGVTVVMVVMVAAVMLANGNVFLVIVVLAFGLGTETHFLWFGALIVPLNRSSCVWHERYEVFCGLIR